MSQTKYTERTLNLDEFINRMRLLRRGIWAVEYGKQNITTDRTVQNAAHLLSYRGLPLETVVKHPDDEPHFWQKVFNMGAPAVRPKLKRRFAASLQTYLAKAQEEGRFDPTTGALTMASAHTSTNPTTGVAYYTPDDATPPNAQERRDLEDLLEMLSAEDIIHVISSRIQELVEEVANLRVDIVKADELVAEARRDSTHWRDEATRLQERVNALGSEVGNLGVKLHAQDLDLTAKDKMIAELESRTSGSGLKLFRGRRAG